MPVAKGALCIADRLAMILGKDDRRERCDYVDKFEQRLDQAARAAWLSYVGGRTQDEIASQLGVSRPGCNAC
jgi:hypothetical protein